MMLEYLAEGGIALLDVNPGLVIWTVITFTLVMIILRVTAWKPIAGALDARAQKIHDDIDRAEGIRKDAEARLDEYNKKLEGLEAEGLEIIARSKKETERLRDEILSEAKKESDLIRARGQREVGLAMDKALEEFHHQVANVAVIAAGKIIEKELKPGDHKKLIDDTISGVRSMN
jgi:F-type H+-transporting ATPase subunit b